MFPILLALCFNLEGLHAQENTWLKSGGISTGFWTSVASDSSGQNIAAVTNGGEVEMDNIMSLRLEKVLLSMPPTIMVSHGL
eukprot:gene24637-31004_t